MITIFTQSVRQSFPKSSDNHCWPGLWAGRVDHWLLLSCVNCICTYYKRLFCLEIHFMTYRILQHIQSLFITIQMHITYFHNMSYVIYMWRIRSLYYERQFLQTTKLSIDKVWNFSSQNVWLFRELVLFYCFLFISSLLFFIWFMQITSWINRQIVLFEFAMVFITHTHTLTFQSFQCQKINIRGDMKSIYKSIKLQQDKSSKLFFISILQWPVNWN